MKDRVYVTDEDMEQMDWIVEELKKKDFDVKTLLTNLSEKVKTYEHESDITDNRFTVGYFEGKAEAFTQVINAIKSGSNDIDEGI